MYEDLDLLTEQSDETTNAKSSKIANATFICDELMQDGLGWVFYCACWLVIIECDL